ncbi:uncharacterized protein LOC121734306 isoform X2 [Aricia agestis]|uniref:uncharacterized protein LOC121734306 isoform X2 n=1 Tax=Aricia agestis TaxID=91739 RepID=UPI001C203E2B|nr:uncharacterized protein LOC121734306 isoform X2 [Aricia agestis]
MFNNQLVQPTIENQRFYGPQVPYQRPPDVVGEGDVVPANFQDGSIHLYFVPVLRRPYQLYYPGSTTYPLPVNSECWYIRSVCNENPSTFLSYFINNVSAQMYSNNQYLQKFHNDHSTSTTDIHYFYPSLRNADQKLSICAAVQTEFENFICCNCLRNSQRTYDEMCIDEGTSRYTHIEKLNEKSNKLVATYTDASSNHTEGFNRETQTELRRMGRSDIIAKEEYVPKKKARRPRRGSCSSDCSCSDLR